MSRLEIKSPIDRYFYKLFKTPKPNLKKASENEISKYMLKKFVSQSYFMLGGMSHKCLGWLTQFHPFSLLYTWKLYHAKNTILRSIVDSIEENAESLKIPIAYRGWDIENQLAILYFKIYLKIDDVESAQRKLEDVLQKNYSNMYVRNADKHIKVFVPLGLIYPNS